MKDLLFEFFQDEIDKLIAESPKGHSIKFSIFSAKEGNSLTGNLFIAAQSFDSSTGAVFASATIPVGCPVPPGWGGFRPIVTNSQLVNNPGFILSDNEKNDLKMNKEAGRHLVSRLEGFSIDNNSPLKMKLSFKIKDEDGKHIKDVDAAVLPVL